ncbi:TcaA second domain-containing protein [Streptococcus loxodontisalivarius]|uniref:Membrane protein YvbJ n=1 Tax=Streptococcus loxodontisalivarius TaxID=1349415 RepID=A0ABS2PUQ3_9STRE|nr:hypothetical protein [Streptococcus loxodontisalivarius]MBM7643435.1 putative membrane protein YvbJ [Streptococcus loxodontisalivarius]
MDKQQKWAALFKDVVGRQATPEEFMAAKASDFDFKKIKEIAGQIDKSPNEQVEVEKVEDIPVTTPIVEAAPIKVKTPLTKAQKWKRFGIGAAVVALIGLGAGYYYCQSITGPDVLAEEFVDAVSINDYDQIASLLSTKTSQWTKDEAKDFINYLKEENIDIEKQLDAIAESNGKSVYNDANGNKLLGMEESGKLLGIFPEYHMVTYPISVSAKTNLADVTVDGKKIAKDQVVSLGETKFISQTYKVTGKTDLGDLTTNASTDLSKAENNEITLSLASNKYKINASLPSDLPQVSDIKLIANGKEIASGLSKELQLMDNQEISVYATFVYEGTTYTTEKVIQNVTPDETSITINLAISSDIEKRIDEAKKAKEAKEAQAQAEKQAQAEAEKAAAQQKTNIQTFMTNYISSMRSSVSSRTVQFSSYFDTSSAVYATYVNYIENQVKPLNIDYQTTLDYTVTNVTTEGSDFVVTVHNKYREVYMNGKSDTVEKNQVFRLRPNGSSYLIYNVSEF